MQSETQNKKITFKFLNQLKLMIKPNQKIVQITHALVTILSGTIASIQGNQIKSDWQSIKHCLRNTNEILEIINDSQTFQKRVRFENLEKSMLILQSIQQQNEDEQNDETFELIQDTLNQLLTIAKPLFKNLLLCKRSNSRNRSLSQQGLSKLQQSQKSFSNKTNISLSQLNQSHGKINRPKSQQSNLSISRSSSNSKDYQKRVIEAQTKKVYQKIKKQQSRLDRILKLQTNKPQAKSQIKQMIEGQQSLNKSYRSNSKESIMRQEIEKNKSIIKKLKQQENAIKWEIERESKRIRENETVNQIQDQINRYKESWQKDQEIKQERRKSNQKKQSSLNKQNNQQVSGQRQNSINYDENKGNALEKDLLISEKMKSEKEQSLNKILKTINNSKQKQLK